MARVIALVELDLQQIEGNDRLIGRIGSQSREPPLGRVQIAPRIIDIGYIVSRVRQISGIGRAILEIAVGGLRVAAHIGGIARPEIILVVIGKVELVGIDRPILVVCPAVIPLLVIERAQRKADVVGTDRIRIVVQKTPEQLLGIGLPLCEAHKAR